MNEQEQNNVEEINTDIISLDTGKGIEKLYKLTQKNKHKNPAINNIKYRYKDFTFYVDLKNVNFFIKQDTENNKTIETIISKPENLEFNGQSCNASKEDDKNTITIINNGEELQFENFSFEKLPYDGEKTVEINTSIKTVFDNIVETGITEAFGYNQFNIKKNEKVEYNFPLHYNANGIFKIPVNENNLPETINIQGTKYKIDKQSAILFKENTDTSINKKPFEYITIDVADNNGKRRYFDIADSIPGDIRKSNCTEATEMQIQYKGNPDSVIQKPEEKNTPNFFTRLFNCCCNKTNNNKETEINIETLNRFEDIQDIVKKTL